jgi:UMF1 family MFS transporter
VSDPASQRRQVFAWVLYDWANSAFATTVMAGFFPVFYKSFWAADVPVTESTFQLGVANSLAGLLVVLGAPVLGALADRGGLKLRLLALFAGMGVAMSGALYLIGEGEWWLALLCYVVGVLGFSGGNVFYDALLVNVALPSRLERLSALGFAAGYLGGGILFAVQVWMVQMPEAFGLADPADAVQLAFLMVALWWALFSIPILLWVPEGKALRRSSDGLVSGAFRQLADTISHIRRLPMTFLFLIAYWLYIDGVDTVVRMAVDFGLALGFEAGDLLAALLLTQFVGFPAALLFGRIGDRLGARQGILLAIVVYILVVFWAWRMTESWEFYALAVAVGLVQGGIQALSRALYARMIPTSRAAEFFGFYNMMGKFAVVLGPLLVGAVGQASGDPRAGMLSLLLLFGSGALLLLKVDVRRGIADARAAEG